MAVDTNAPSIDMTVPSLEAFRALHQQQLVAVPAQLHAALYRKLLGETFDSGDHVELIPIDPDTVDDASRRGAYALCAKDAMATHADIFLIDQAWMSSGDEKDIEKDLHSYPHLLERMETIMGLGAKDADSKSDKDVAKDLSDEEKELVESVVQMSGTDADKALEALRDNQWSVVDAICALTMTDEMREADAKISESVMPQLSQSMTDKHQQARVDRVKANFYRFASTFTMMAMDPSSGETHQISAWYMMDEVGSAVAHSETPNCVIFPFAFVGPFDGATAASEAAMRGYCLLMPIKDIAAGDMFYCDRLPSDIRDPQERQAYTFAFERVDVDVNAKKPLLGGAELPSTLPPLSNLSLSTQDRELMLNLTHSVHKSGSSETDWLAPVFDLSKQLTALVSYHQSISHDKHGQFYWQVTSTKPSLQDKTTPSVSRVIRLRDSGYNSAHHLPGHCLHRDGQLVQLRARLYRDDKNEWHTANDVSLLNSVAEASELGDEFIAWFDQNAARHPVAEAKDWRSWRQQLDRLLCRQLLAVKDVVFPAQMTVDMTVSVESLKPVIVSVSGTGAQTVVEADTLTSKFHRLNMD